MRKHSKWLWIIIIAVVIVTFVIFFSPNSRMSGGYVQGNYGSINGHQVTREDYINAQHEVELAYFFNAGNWPDLNDEQMMRQSYLRLLLIRQQEDLGVHVSSESTVKAADEILRAHNQGNPVPPETFVSQVIGKRGLTADDFERFVRHNLGIQQLVSVMGFGGMLVTEEEVRALYEREYEEVSAQAVFFSASNHLGEITVTPEALREYYTNQMANYRLPDRVQVAYVQFPASNFMSEAEEDLSQIPNLEERVEEEYQRRGGTNFYIKAKSPEEAKEMIRGQVRADLALVRARKAAYEFVVELDAITPVSGENLGNLAAKKGLVANLSEPFDRQFPPPDLKVHSDFMKQAFALTVDEPFAGPIVGEDAAFVIALNKKIPSEIPQLDQIKEQVTEDYKFSRAVSVARQAGTSFAAMLAAGIPNGKEFTNLCAEAKVHHVSLRPFSLSTRALPEVEAHADLSRFKEAAFGTAPGKPGEFVATKEGGFVVFVQSKLPIDEAKMNKDLPQFTSNVRRARASEAFNTWLGKEAEVALRNTPAARPLSTGASPE